MEGIFSYLSRFYYRLSDKNKLLPFEKMCLDAWRNSLSERQKTTLDTQLKSIDVVQHQAGGAKVCFFQVMQKSVPLFPNQKPDQCVAHVILKSGDAPSAPTMPAKIFVQRGRFFSIEFPKRPRRYMKLHGMNEQTLRVVEVVAQKSLEK